MHTFRMHTVIQSTMQYDRQLQRTSMKYAK